MSTEDGNAIEIGREVPEDEIRIHPPSQLTVDHARRQFHVATYTTVKDMLDLLCNENVIGAIDKLVQFMDHGPAPPDWREDCPRRGTIFDTMLPWYYSGLDCVLGAKAGTNATNDQPTISGASCVTDVYEKVVTELKVKPQDYNAWKVTCALVYLYVVYTPDTFLTPEDKFRVCMENYLERLCPESEDAFRKVGGKKLGLGEEDL